MQIEFARNEGCKKTHTYIAPENVASLNLIRKLGFEYEEKYFYAIFILEILYVFQSKLFNFKREIN